METVKLQGDLLDLYNEIASLDSESVAKVKKYIRRMIGSKRKVITQINVLDDIDDISDEEIENAMRPLTHEEKMERLRLAEEDTTYYTHQEVVIMTSKWIK